MINDEILNVLIDLVEDARGVLIIQAGTLAECPQSQPVGSLFIDKTTRVIYRFDGRIWESLLISSGFIEPSVSREVTPLYESDEFTISRNNSLQLFGTSSPY